MKADLFYAKQPQIEENHSCCFVGTPAENEVFNVTNSDAFTPTQPFTATGLRDVYPVTVRYIQSRKIE